jgi:hypothetical protein
VPCAFRRLGEQVLTDDGRSQERDLCALRHRDRTVRVAGVGEGRVGEEEQVATVGDAVPVHHPHAHAGSAGGDVVDPDVQHLAGEIPGEHRLGAGQAEAVRLSFRLCHCRFTQGPSGCAGGGSSATEHAELPVTVTVGATKSLQIR